MRHLLSILLLGGSVLSTGTAAAQPAPYETPDTAYYAAFVQKGNTWHTVETTFGQAGAEVTYRLGENEVERDGHTYLPMYRTKGGNDKMLGLLREEARRVYVLDEASNHEYRLYDFTAAKGDTIDVAWDMEAGACESRRFVVTEVGTTSVSDCELHTLTLKYLAGNGAVSWPQLTWIEGVGNRLNPLGGFQFAEADNGTREEMAYALLDDEQTFLAFDIERPWHGQRLEARSLTAAEEAALDDTREDQLRYELIPDARSGYTLHVSGTMWLPCVVSGSYIFCVEEPMNSLQRTVRLQKNFVGTATTCQSHKAVDLYFTDFDAAATYATRGGDGEEIRRLDDYRPLVEEGKVWTTATYATNWNAEGVDFAHPTKLEMQRLEGDTLVGGKLCKKWLTETLSETPSAARYVAAVYETGRRIYVAKPGETDFGLLYDFSVQPMDTLWIRDNAESDTLESEMSRLLVYRQKASETDTYKGIRTTVFRHPTDISSTATMTDWMVGVGHMGFKNMRPEKAPDKWQQLISCTVGDEVLYLDTALLRGLPEIGNEEVKKRIDFTHVIKSQPKMPRRRAAAETPDGEYNSTMFLNLQPLKGAYSVRLTDSEGREVYSHTVKTDNVLALETDLRRYDAGTYTLQLENNVEIYTATLEIGRPEDVETPKMASDSHSDTGIYDLSGRKVGDDGRNAGRLPHGIYIRDGRKMVR